MLIEQCSVVDQLKSKDGTCSLFQSMWKFDATLLSFSLDLDAVWKHYCFDYKPSSHRMSSFCFNALDGENDER